MPRVLLQRPAFLDNALCARGSIVTISDDAPLASWMTLVPDAATPVPDPAAKVLSAVADQIVTVHADAVAHEVDINVGGVEMHIDHATLKVN